MWKFIYAATFLVAFVLSIVVTMMWPADFGGIGKVTWNESVGKVYLDLAYAEGPLNKFDLYVPASIPKSTTKLVLYIHAGGFTGGDKADDAMWAKYFVSKGYVAATINYTTHTKEHPSNVYRMSREIQQGVAAIKAAAAQRGYQLDEMIVAGGSAGGALAMIYAYRDYATSPLTVKAVVQMVGPGSFEPAGWFDFDTSYTSAEQAQAAAGFVSMMTGDSITRDMMRSGAYKEKLSKVSPDALVSVNSVPTLIGYGPYDKVVPIRLSNYLFAAFKKYGVTYDYVEFSHSGHGLNRDPEKARLFVEKMNEYLHRYLGDAR
jgi:acetyl esterase/lipase